MGWKDVPALNLGDSRKREVEEPQENFLAANTEVIGEKLRDNGKNKF